jgi:hypothetical protein
MATLLSAVVLITNVLFAQTSAKPVVDRSFAAEKQKDPALEAALKQLSGGSFEGTDTYYYNRVDLNQDGNPELLVLLEGPGVCGSGGCPLFVLGHDNNRYRLITKITLARAPVIVSNNRVNGWADLILFVRGGGILPGYYSVLHFDGRSYPTNPSVLPAEILQAGAGGVAYMSDAYTDGAGVSKRP